VGYAKAGDESGKSETDLSHKIPDRLLHLRPRNEPPRVHGKPRKINGGFFLWRTGGAQGTATSQVIVNLFTLKMLRKKLVE